MRERPSKSQSIMAIAGIWSQLSTCSRGQVGVVIAKDFRPLVMGFNGAPAGMPHCDHECDCGLLVDPDTGVTGHEVSCLAVLPCTISVHAEANAIAFAAKHGIKLEGTQLFTTMCPCLACAMLVINAGISHVIVGQYYRDKRGHDLLRDAGIVVTLA